MGEGFKNCLKLRDVIYRRCWLTEDIDQCQEFTEEVSVGPEVVVLQVGVQVVEEELLLLTFLGLGDDPQVQVHLQGPDLAGLPVLPQPAWNVK